MFVSNFSFLIFIDVSNDYIFNNFTIESRDAGSILKLKYFQTELYNQIYKKKSNIISWRHDYTLKVERI